MARFNDPNTMTNVVAFTRAYFDSIFVEERLIGAKLPDLSMELFGKTFASPIMTPAFSHLKTFAAERENGLCEYSRAAAELHQVNWVGMMTNEEYATLSDTGAQTIRIIKPYADKDEIFSRIAFAQERGALAVGIDIDHSFGDTGAYDVCGGYPMISQSVEDLRTYIDYTNLPFVVKGVLSVSDALKCEEADVSAIVVSHHHGRMPFAVPPLMVLPDIVRALGPKRRMKIFVDCSIDSGYDAFKALCLGADAVSAGRVLFPDLIRDGCEGVKRCLERMNHELAQMMAYTGCATLGAATPALLRRADGSKFEE